MDGKAPTYSQGALLFVPDDYEAYIPAAAVEEFQRGEKGKVKLLQGGVEKELSKTESAQVERMDEQNLTPHDDMISLKLLNDASLLHNLKLRYANPKRMNIYTNIGSILVSINPYKDQGLYTPEMELKYLESGGTITTMEPHIFKVAEQAFYAMENDEQDQSCVITGESGAGKTEATKRFLQYIAEKSRRNKDRVGGDSGIDSQKLRQQILDSNPFMEAFGNAKTLRNDNSSRFGKLIEMYFEKGGVVIGATITNYLLEKSRVVRVQAGERNYHIFYQLCEAATTSRPEFKKKYHLQSADMFNYCMGGNKKLADLKVPDTNDGQIFDETIEAMKKLNFSEEDLDTVWRICAGLLHFGNIEFVGKDATQLADGVIETALKRSAELFGVDATALERGLLKRQLLNNVERHHSKQEAEAARDALAKHLYDKMFDWLITMMNATLSKHLSSASGNVRVLGVLDIFGFETFEVNSFEQLCINFCNEKLQAFFNFHVFKREQKMYKEEGINCEHIGFYDNQGVVDTIETGPKSIMVICDDSCWLESATDDNFLKKILVNAKNVTDKDIDNHYLFKPKVQDIRKKAHLKDAFTVKHFAGFVHYNVENFLEKNKDQLRVDLRNVLGSSKLKLVSDFFPDESETGAGRNAQYRKTLGSKFKDSLNRLMEKLNHTIPQFVRTIKPNDEKVPGKFDSQKIFKQLREAGLLEVCKIRKLGYPIRITHRDFMNKYLCLDKSGKDIHDLCAKLSKAGVLHGNKNPNWQIGKTQVFLRPDQLDDLDRGRGEALKTVIKLIRDTIRRYLFRVRTLAAIEAQKNIREGKKKRDGALLLKGLEFFTGKGPLFENLPIVQGAKEMMKELQVQVDLLQALDRAITEKDINTLKVKIEVAKEIGLSRHAKIQEAEELLEKWQTEKAVKTKLEKAVGSQDVNELKAAVAYATENGYGDIHACRMAASMLKTFEEREDLLTKLKKALEKTGNVDAIAEIVTKLRDNGCPDDHPLIIEAVRRGEMILEQNKKREQQMGTMEKQLKKNIKKRDLEKLRELVVVAIDIKFTGPLVQEAVELIQALEARNDLIQEVVGATRVLRDKSRLPEGVKDQDLQPLQHAIKSALKYPELELEKEVQLIDGNKLLDQMKEQLKIQKNIADALKKGTEDSLYSVLEAIQRLGLQTRDADMVCQRVREYEMLKAKAASISNQEKVNDCIAKLRVPSEEERQTHLGLRVEAMYSKEFRELLKQSSKNRDLTMRKFYKVRSDVDFMSKEHSEGKKELLALKHAHIGGRPISKSMLEMDDMQERIAVLANQMIVRFCDERTGNKKDSLEACMRYLVENGIADTTIADEIFIQLCKHLTANPNANSKNKAWYLMCLCTTYFGCSTTFQPYLLHYLNNSVNDNGLEGNYARYCIAQLSASMSFNAKEVGYTPGSAELKAFFERPPVLAQLELVNGTIENIPIPPDYRLQECTAMIRKRTKIMSRLKDPEWAIYVRATNRPAKITFRQRLENFYRRYKPENLANIDSILDYHQDNEEGLFADLTSMANYGPEPTPTAVGPTKKNAKKGSGKSVSGEYADDLLDDAASAFSSGSKMSVGSAISAVGSTISKMFRRARGLSTVEIQNMEVPNPTIAWPLPWWCYLGDIMHSLYEQDKVPVLTYKRRYCKMKGKPDDNLFLQLQRDFMEGTIAPYTLSENARLSALILAVALLMKGKTMPYGDPQMMKKEGLLKCIPKTLRRANKKNSEWMENYLELCAEKSNDFRELTDVKKLQRKFFEECVQVPTYGMSFFFAQVLKGNNVRTYIAKNTTSEEESSGVKVGINQREIAFFYNGRKAETFAMDEITKYWCDGSTFTMKVKKSKKRSTQRAGDGFDATLNDHNLTRMNSRKFDFSTVGGFGDEGPRKSPFSAGFKTFRGALFSFLGLATETVQLYTLQPREMYDLVYMFKTVEKENREE